MVKITPEEVIRRRQLEQRSTDELDDLDRAIVGEVARLDIPLNSVVGLRRVAEHLRGLASALDVLSKRDDLVARSVLFEARMTTREVNRRLRRMRPPGRPARSSGATTLRSY